jgi:hypothetical protein
MVKPAFVVILAHAALVTASADAHPVGPDDIDDQDRMVAVEEEDDSPAFNMLGFTMGIGGLPIDGERTFVGSVGLGIEHPVFKKTRVGLEYELLWMSRRDDSMRPHDPDAFRPEHHGSGHRASMSLRRELKAKNGRTIRWFIDGELAATVALVNDNMDGARVIPGGFTGVRLGYDIYTRKDDSPSRTFETALFFRGYGTGDGIGFSGGLGMFWGN